MLRYELLVSLHSVRAPGVVPVLVLAKLDHARSRLRSQLTFRVLLDELVVSLNRICCFRRAPILLFPAAPCEQDQ